MGRALCAVTLATLPPMSSHIRVLQKAFGRAAASRVRRCSVRLDRRLLMPIGHYDPEHPSSCSAKCVHGYSQSGGSYTCSRFGLWTGGPKCIGIVCDALPSVDHHAGCPQGHFGSDYDGTCALSCDSGYIASEQARPYTCTADGKWTGGSITCSPALCPATPPAPHATSCAAGHYDPKRPSNCSVQCAHGFSPTGFVVSGTTQELFGSGALNGFYDWTVDTCHSSPVYSQRAGPASSHGFILKRVSSYGWMMDAINYSSVCQPYGFVENQKFNAADAWPDAAEAAGEWRDTTGANHSWKTNPDMVVAGGGRYTCSANGTWSGVSWAGSAYTDRSLTCIGVLCDAGDPLPGTKHHSSCSSVGMFGGSTFYNDTCTLRCLTGYDSSNVKPFTCSADGAWAGGSITCSPMQCPAGPPTAHATSCKAGHYESDTDHPELCTVECSHGYVNTGQGDGCYTCDAEGNWTAASAGGGLVCAGAVCDSGDPLPSAAHHGSCGQGQYDGVVDGTCTLSCDPGYTASKSTNFTCSAAGKWTGGSITCSPVECPAEPPAPHTQPCLIGHYNPGHPSTCSPNCEHGHVNVGTGDGSYTWH